MIDNVKIACLIPCPIRNKNFTSEKFQVFHLRQLPNDAKWLLVVGYMMEYVQIFLLNSRPISDARGYLKIVIFCWGIDLKWMFKKKNSHPFVEKTLGTL